MGNQPLDQTNIAQTILLIRGHRVILDSDLATLYGVQTKALIQAVKRNQDRFPEDFMYQLTLQEVRDLRSQNVTSSFHGGRRHLPYVFTEHGTLMLASILNSKRAVEMSLLIVRVFVKLREMLSAHKELSQKLTRLERKIESHDEEIRTLFEAIRQLIAVPQKPQRRIGFTV